jgi:uncharacterized membrane protein YkoI
MAATPLVNRALLPSLGFSNQEDVMSRCIRCLGAFLVAASVMLMAAAQGQDKDKPKAEKIALDKVPQKIMTAVMTRFPGAKLRSVEKEVEDGKVVFDVELTHQGRKYEMDIKEDGTIVEIEKEVAAKDLPKAVTTTLKSTYPKATIKEIMEVNKVNGTQETPDHYEVVLTTADGKTLEVEVSLTGKILKGGKAESDKK